MIREVCHTMAETLVRLWMMPRVRVRATVSVIASMNMSVGVMGSLSVSRGR